MSGDFQRYPSSPFGGISVILFVSAFLVAGYFLTQQNNIRLIPLPQVNYTFNVMSKTTGQSLENVTITYSIDGEEIASQLTDSRGATIFTVAGAHADKVMEVIIEHPGYKLYRQQILVDENMNYTVQLEMDDAAMQLPNIQNNSEVAPPAAQETTYHYLAQFETTTTGWLLGLQDTNVEYRFVNGQYHQLVTFAEREFVEVTVPANAIPNFRWQTSTAILAAPGSGSIQTSFKFREDTNGNYYVLRISNTGQYGFYLKYDNEWVTLLSPTTTSAISTAVGATNEVTITAQGNQFIITINSQELATITDPSSTLLQAGAFSLATDGTAGLSATIMFDDIAITNLD